MSLISLIKGMVEIGDVAPDFTLKDQDKNEVTLSSYAGNRVILSFYPAAFTGVCTNQACSINDNHSALGTTDVHVLGISVDAPFGVTFDNFAIDGYTVAQRSVFLVEADGTIGYAWYADNPGIEPDYSALFAHISDEN